MVLSLPVRSANGLVDRLLRGRAWVACIGALLAGIVFLNVSLLGLNAGIAVTSDQAAELRRDNAELRLEVAKLGSSERIQRVAEERGFVMPAPGDVAYLESDPEADGRSAALALEDMVVVTDTALTTDPDAAAASPEPPEPTTAATSVIPEPTTATPPVAPEPTAESPPEPAG